MRERERERERERGGGGEGMIAIAFTDESVSDREQTKKTNAKVNDNANDGKTCVIKCRNQIIHAEASFV